MISGEAEVLAPTGKIKRERVELPEVTISDRWGRYHKLIARAKGLPPQRRYSPTRSTLNRCRARRWHATPGILRPVLVGSEKEMRAVAEENKIDLKLCRLVDAPHSRAALARALEMARSGEAEILVQGGIPTHEFLIPIVGPNGLRSVRRLSHVLDMDVPSYPRPFVISDMMVNIEPTLEDKIDIVQNAIDFAHIMGIPEPKVAISPASTA